jgi:hypothetical protein
MLSTSLIKRKWQKRREKEERRAAAVGIIISLAAVPAFLIHPAMGNSLHPDITRALFCRKEY